MMNYPKTYSNVVRYGKAPAQDLNELAPESEGSYNFDSNNLRHKVLADKLGDYGDFREEIVRRDLALRGASNDDYWSNFGKESKEMKDKHNSKYNIVYNFPDKSGYIRIEADYNNKTRVLWNINGHEFTAHFTNEETEEILRQLKEDHGIV